MTATEQFSDFSDEDLIAIRTVGCPLCADHIAAVVEIGKRAAELSHEAREPT